MFKKPAVEGEEFISYQRVARRQFDGIPSDPVVRRFRLFFKSRHRDRASLPHFAVSLESRENEVSFQKVTRIHVYD